MSQESWLITKATDSRISRIVFLPHKLVRMSQARRSGGVPAVNVAEAMNTVRARLPQKPVVPRLPRNLNQLAKNGPSRRHDKYRAIKHIEFFYEAYLPSSAVTIERHNEHACSFCEQSPDVLLPVIRRRQRDGDVLRHRGTGRPGRIQGEIRLPGHPDRRLTFRSVGTGLGELHLSDGSQ